MGTATKEKVGTVSAYENLKQCKNAQVLEYGVHPRKQLLKRKKVTKSK
jgi:hypothetical protein